MTGQLLGYVRVSTTDQNTARQEAAIGDVDRLFVDTTSGGSRHERPALAALLAHARGGDTVRVASMDRLARSVADLEAIVTEATGRGVTVEFLAEHLVFAPDVEDHLSTFQLHMLGAVAQLERSLIRERQREGIALARARGAYRGRARALTPEQVQAARERIASGVAKAKVAREAGCSRQVLYDALAGVGAYAPPAGEGAPPDRARSVTSGIHSIESQGLTYLTNRG